MAETILELQAVCKSFGKVLAVDDVTLSIGTGEFLTFLGPSGSGKTTTLMMVAGFQKVTGGAMMLDGRPLDPLPAYKRDIGMVFQHYALFPHMTVARNVSFPLEVRKVAKDEIRRRVDDVLKLVGLPEHGARYPGQLSGGQQQRVALARAMVFQPRLLLMDEPLGALDKKLREHMQIEIMHLHRDLGITVLYVTHDQEEALVMSDRIAVFNEGRIEQIGTPDDLYENPATRFVADFIGESNFLAGRVTGRENGEARIDGLLPLRGRAADDLADHAEAVMAVRPERLRIGPPGHDGADDANHVAGRVTDIVYLGQSRKFIVRLADGSEMTALVQANVQGLESVAAGSEVSLSWRAEDCKILPRT